MTDDGADIRPVTEAPAGAPVETPAPLPPPASTPPLPKKPSGVPPMVEYAVWRLAEGVATILAAMGVIIVVLGGGAFEMAPVPERLGVTLPLVLLAALIAGVTGLPVGYAAARRAESPLDLALRAIATSSGSLAPIWLAMLLVLLFAATLQWLQPGGFVPWAQNPVGALLSLLLPALALGLPLGAELALETREAMQRAQRTPMIRAAEVMGLTRREAVHAYAIRNALVAVTGKAGLHLALLVPASLVVENVFYLPGLGRLIFTALGEQDLPTLRGGLLALVMLIALCRFGMALLHAWADPRLARRA